MENASDQLLHTRADGFTEDASGNVAIVVTVSGTAVEGGNRTFTYRASYISEPVTIGWDPKHDFSLFPEDVTLALIRLGHGRVPTEAELDVTETESAEPADAPIAPESPVSAPPTPQPKPEATTPPKPASAPPVKPTAKPKKASTTKK